MKWLGIVVLGLGLSACAGTSFGVSSDGTFPPRPSGVDYPNWEHMCSLYDQSTATDVLNRAGDQGWELVGLGTQGSNNLMCFKRPKAADAPSAAN